MEGSVEHQLIAAASNGDLPAVQLIAEHGAKLDWQDSTGDTALMKAVCENHSAVCKELLRRGADPNKSNKWGTSAMHKASGYGQREIVTLLATNGADVNCTDNQGSTPSHCAAFWERIGVLEDLYSYGADWTILNNEQQDVLAAAKFEKKCKAAKFVEEVLSGKRKIKRRLAVHREEEITELNGQILDLHERIEQLEDEKQFIENRLDDEMKQTAEVRTASQQLQVRLDAQSGQMVDLRRQNEHSKSEKLQLEQQVRWLKSQLKEQQQRNGELKQHMKHAVSSTGKREADMHQKVQGHANELLTLQQKVQHQEAQLHYKQKALDTLSSQHHENVGKLQQLDAYRRAKENAEAALKELERRTLETNHLLNIAVEDVLITGTQLGHGSFGEVRIGYWRGYHVAVKVFRELLVADQYNRRILEQEIAICSRLRHPCIAGICGVTRKDGAPISLVMELLQGSLADIIKAAERSRQCLTLREQLDMSRDCLCGLIYLHKITPNCILHGDIRPTNVLVTSVMHAKLGDLGAARFSNASLSVGPMSPEYVAPERLADRTIPNNIASDIYSMGITLCEMFTGERSTLASRLRNLQAVRHFTLRDMCLQMASAIPRERPAASEAVKMIIHVMEKREYWQCPPRRMVKGLLDGESCVKLTEMPW